MENNFLNRGLIIALSMLCFFAAFAAENPKDLEGSWKGVLKIPGGVELRIVFNFIFDENGKLSATLDSPDQGAKGIPISNLTFENKQLRFEVPSVAGSFEGTFIKEGPKIEGTWRQGPRSLPLVLDKYIGETEKNVKPLGEPVGEEEQNKITGNWQGTLTVQGFELRLVFKIAATPENFLKATLDSPDQGAMDIPVSKVSFKDDQLRLEAKGIGGVYEGQLNEKKSEIEGKWSQGGQSWPLHLKRTDKPIELNRPQEPKKPYPYREEEVQFANEKVELRLAGTLTLPKSGGPFPAILLITGSGPQDRDETVAGHKPFWIIADYLTRKGIAVLRVDDRGTGKSTGFFKGATSGDFATDVLAGVAYLKTRKEINPKQIGLVGHSEGGLIAPMVAVQSPDVAFIILLAGPGVTGSEILVMQGALISRAGGTSEALIKQGRTYSKRMYEIVKTEPDNSIAEKKIREMHAKSWAALSEDLKKETKELVPDLEGQLDMTIKQILTPWFRYFLIYDPRPTLQKVNCPVLAINGEKDLQVPPKENLAAIAKALKAGGNSDFTLKKIPDLNHLFQHAETGSLTEYSKIEETFAPEALQIIGDWIKSRIGTN